MLDKRSSQLFLGVALFMCRHCCNNAYIYARPSSLRVDGSAFLVIQKDITKKEITLECVRAYEIRRKIYCCDPAATEDAMAKVKRVARMAEGISKNNDIIDESIAPTLEPTPKQLEFWNPLPREVCSLHASTFFWFV